MGLKGPLIDDVEHVPLLDPRTVGKRLTLEQPGNLTADFDGVWRLRLRHVFVVNGHSGWLDLDHGHLRWRRRLRLRITFAATQGE